MVIGYLDLKQTTDRLVSLARSNFLDCLLKMNSPLPKKSKFPGCALENESTSIRVAQRGQVNHTPPPYEKGRPSTENMPRSYAGRRPQGARSLESAGGLVSDVLWSLRRHRVPGVYQPRTRDPSAADHIAPELHPDERPSGK